MSALPETAHHEFVACTVQHTTNDQGPHCSDCGEGPDAAIHTASEAGPERR